MAADKQKIINLRNAIFRREGFEMNMARIGTAYGEPPADAAYRVLARMLRRPRVQKVSPDALRELIEDALLVRAELDAAIQLAMPHASPLYPEPTNQQ